MPIVILFICIRNEFADVTQSDGPRSGGGDRMHQYIGVIMASRPPAIRHIQPAYNQRSFIGKCMNIKTMSDPYHLSSPPLLMIDSATTRSSRVVILILL